MSELTDEQLDGIDIVVDMTIHDRVIGRQIRAAIAELRSLRERALTAEEREALQLARSIVAVHHAAGRWPCVECAPALAILDRLLARGGKP